MTTLFERERSVITKHIRNIFKEGELLKDQVCAKFAHTAADGKTYQVEHYNLDVIISVGYRVKSKWGRSFASGLRSCCLVPVTARMGYKPAIFLIVAASVLEIISVNLETNLKPVFRFA